MTNYPKMNPKEKNLWIEQLRSEKFKQGRGLLKVENEPEEFEHCCLGVFAEMQQIPEKKVGKVYHFNFPNFEEDCTTMLPSKWFCEFFKGDENKVCKVAARLARMNDDENCTFHAIADWIEENL